MAAPTFVGAGTGVIITTGSAAVSAAGVAHAVGDLFALHILQDGLGTWATHTISNLADLAGGTTALSTTTAAEGAAVGSPGAARHHLYLGRITGASPSVTVTTSGDDLYCRAYVFRGVNTGATWGTVVESTSNASVGTSAVIADGAVVTTGADRLALQFVAVDDDNPVGPFTGMSGGTWVEAVPEFASATGTDGCIQLQISGMGDLSDLVGMNSGQAMGSVSTADQLGRPFTAPYTGTLQTVSMDLVAFGSPTDDVIVEIRTDTGGSGPSTTVLGSAATIDPTVASFLTFRATVAAPITSGTTYWIVIRRTGAINASVNYGWEESNTAKGSFGHWRRTTAGTWVEATGEGSNQLTYALSGSGAAGTINGGSYTMAASDNWGVIGLALIPPPSGPATLERSAALGLVGLIATIGRELLPRSAVVSAVGAVTAAGVKVTPGVTYERSAALAATASISTVGRELLPRAAVVAATGQVQAAGVRIRVIARTAAIGATASIATVGRELLSRSAVINATAGIATVGRELLARSAAIGATGAIAAAGREQLARLVELGALAQVTASGVAERPGVVIHSRSAAVSATGAIATAGRELLPRSTAVGATATVAAAGRKVVVRSAAVGAIGPITATGQLQGAVTGSAALTAAGGIASVPQRRLSRSAAVTATGNIAAAARRDLVRAAVIDAVAAIDLTAGGAFGHIDLDALAQIDVSGEKLWAARPPGYIDLPGVGLVTQPIRGSLVGAGTGRIDAAARGRRNRVERSAGMTVVTFERFLPPARYDSNAWTEARIEEASAEDGTFTLIDTIALSPVDVDPTDPQYRSFTTEAGTADGYWYQIVFADATGDQSAPTAPIQNTAGTGFSIGEPYATTDELFRILKIRTPTVDQVAAAERVLIAAAGEIHAWMGRETALTDWELQLVTEVNLERGAELWQETEVPFGVVGLDSPGGPVFVSRHSRALAKLTTVRQSFGVAWSSLVEIVEALATALEPLREDIPDLQIYPYWLANATPPTVDIYPGDPFQDGLGFGANGGTELFFTVRARVTTADSEAGQKLLYQILEPATGIGAVLVEDPTLGGVVDYVAIGDEGAPGVSGLREYVEDVAVNGRLLGAEWRVRVLT